jgi:O-antigen/teichoic acid export membrane protein
MGVRRIAPGLRPEGARLARSAATSYLTLSGLALLAQVSDVVDSQWDKIVLSRYVGSTAVASFQVGTSIVLQAKAVAVLPLVPLLAAAAELHHRDPARLERLTQVLSRIGGVTAAVIVGGVFAFGPAFLDLWLGTDLPDAHAVVRLFAVAIGANLVGAPLALRAFGEGGHRIAAASAVVNVVVNGAGSLLLTLHLGLEGALWGSIAGNVAGTVVFLVLVRRSGRTGPLTIAWRSSLLGVVATAAVVWTGLDRVGSWPALALTVTVFAIVVGAAGALAERLSPAAFRSVGP